MKQQIEYRAHVEDGEAEQSWTRAPDSEPGDEVTILGLAEGVVYDVRARLVSEDDTPGAWFYCGDPCAASKGALLGLDDEPAPLSPPLDLRVERDGCLFWTPPVDTPQEAIVGYKVRHAAGDYQTFDAMIPAHVGLVLGPPLELCDVPAGVRTISVVAVRTDGVESVPATIAVNRGDYDERLPTVVTDVAHDPAFPGTPTNLTLSGGDLVQTVTDERFFGNPEDAGAEFFGADDAEFFATRVDRAEYRFVMATAQPDSDDGRILTLAPGVTGDNWRAEYRRDADAFFGPDGAEFFDGEFFFPPGDDGDFFGDNAAPFFAEDGSPFFEELAWLPWPGKLAVRDAMNVEVRIVIPGGAKDAGAISTLSVAVTKPAETGDLASLDVAPGALLRQPQILAGSGTFTPIAGTTRLEVELVGAGGGGAGAQSGVAETSGGGGGAAGGYAFKRISSPATSYAYSVGAGGAGGGATADGSDGGDTTFGSSLTAKGGGGGKNMPTGAGVATTTPAVTVAGTTGGDIMSPGGSGGPGIRLSGAVALSGAGGASKFGAGGAPVVASGNGSTTVAKGAGGSGAMTSGVDFKIGGAGAVGTIVVREYA